LNSAESITRIIEKSTPLPPPPTNPPPPPTNPPPPPPPSSASSVQSSASSASSASSVQSYVQSQASLGQAPPGGRAAGTASAPSARRRQATNLFQDDPTTDEESSQKSLSLKQSRTAAPAARTSFTNRRHNVDPPFPDATAFNAAQQVRQLNAPLHQAVAASGDQALLGASSQASHGARAAASTRAAAGTAKSNQSQWREADAAQAYRAAGARNMSPVPHDKSFMGQPFVEQFPHGSATASAAPPIVNSRFTLTPPPPSSFTQPPREPEPPFDPPRDPRYDDPDYLSRGTHPGGGY